MSITLMSLVWPLEMSSTDKLVLLALADAANDEEGHTWIPIKSKAARNRAGRLKLNLCVKTSLKKRAVQLSLRRLEDGGHITREEKPGIGVDYWIHPVASPLAETSAPDAPVQKMRGACDAREGAGAAPKGRRSCTQTIKNPKQPGAGARTQASRGGRPPAGALDGPAAGSRAIVVKERLAEGDRERGLRIGISERAGDPAPPWLERIAFRVSDLVEAGGPVGVNVYCMPSERGGIERREMRLRSDAAEILGVEVRWISFIEGTRT